MVDHPPLLLVRATHMRATETLRTHIKKNVNENRARDIVDDLKSINYLQWNCTIHQTKRSSTRNPHAWKKVKPAKSKAPDFADVYGESTSGRLKEYQLSAVELYNPSNKTKL